MDCAVTHVCLVVGHDKSDCDWMTFVWAVHVNLLREHARNIKKNNIILRKNDETFVGLNIFRNFNKYYGRIIVVSIMEMCG